MRSLLLDGAGQPDDLRGESPLGGLQDPAFGVREPREVKGDQLAERPFGLVEAALELVRGGTEGRDGGGAWCRHGAAGVPHQRLARGRVGHGAPGGEERLRLPRAQAVALDGVSQALLIRAWQHRQPTGRGRRQAPRVYVRGHVRREAAAKGQPPLDPAPAAAEQRGDLRDRQVIVVGQRADHARLVHGAQGPPRGVGLEETGLARDARGVFHDHGDVRAAVADPARQPLEPVEHFVGAGAGGGDAQGERGQWARRIGARSPQRRQRRGEACDRQLNHETLRVEPRARVLRIHARRHLAHHGPPTPHGLDTAAWCLAKWNARGCV
jgi:hypothetical protein